MWSFPPPTERRLGAAVAAGASVIVLFSVSGSGAFQGCGAYSGHTGAEGSRTGVRPLRAQGGIDTVAVQVRLDWLASNTVTFASPAVAQLANM